MYKSFILKTKKVVGFLIIYVKMREFSPPLSDFWWSRVGAVGAIFTNNKSVI